MMVKPRPRRKHCPPTVCCKLQAKVHVIESNRQIILVEAADSKEFVGADHQAGAGNSEDRLLYHQPVHVARGIAWKMLVSMRCNRANAANDASMLHAPVAIEEFGAYGTDGRPRRYRHHLRQPVVLDDLDIIVDEGQHTTASRSDGQVV